MLPFNAYGVSFAKRYREDQIATADRHRLSRQAKSVRESEVRRPERPLLRRMLSLPLLRSIRSSVAPHP
jgi:hypothetical protein